MSEMEYGNVDLEILINEEYLGHEYLIRLGWDYGHCCDYTYYNVVDSRSKVLVDLSRSLYNDLNLSEEKKWTTEEIQEEAKSVIEQLIKLLNKEEPK